MIRINNIDKWKRLEPGKHIELPGDRLRRVRLEVNCPQPTRFDVIEYDINGEEAYGTFIAVIMGKDIIEFTGEGDLTVIPSVDDVAAEVFYFAQDGDQTAVERPGEETFTELMTRQARDPVMERYMYMQQLNFERRMDAMQADTAAQIAAMGTTFNVRTGEPDDENSPPAARGAAAEEQQQPAEPVPAKTEGKEPPAPVEPKPVPAGKAGTK
ncbi:hypothetical protein SAMN05428969_3273 [Devosia sp. YR412]|uniref:hypothetical protein n=1 Tax=Devosia sp. YR412 TaxID=1881030 RepID=UPI0008AFC36E|nr:hypothetical protein [Devosia sp. YR412]SEQ49386.1 hypothetical protein SAMN05428969_3273 [Devosia sp. YR412]